MSNPEPQQSFGEATSPAMPEDAQISWTEKLAAVLYCVFCFEVGIFLIVYPWMGAWGRNYLFQTFPEWTPFLLSQQFRGAITGVGILNLFIAFGEVLRLRRFAGKG